MTGNPYPQAKKIEVVDLENPSNICTLGEFPIGLSQAVGGFTKHGPLVCGGYNSGDGTRPNKCYKHNSSGQFEETEEKLQSKREGASAVVLPNETLWIQGGWDGSVWLASTEIFDLEGSQDGIELEKKSRAQCAMMINSTTAFITGGNTGSWSAETFFFNVQTGKRTKGPKMNVQRGHHGCALFIYNGQNYVMVAGGLPFTSSTEILDLQNGDQWNYGMSSFAKTFNKLTKQNVWEW